jgi:hypothetical protein
MNDLALHILDIVQNSISAGALLIRIIVSENLIKDLLSITIEDNGKGMTEEQVSKLADPFFTSRTTRKVGMGIPLFKQSAEQSGGRLDIKSKVGIGTTITATFAYSNIDRPPLGDVANAVIILVTSNPTIRFVYEYSFNDRSYLFDTKEIMEVLGDVPINTPGVAKYLEEMVKENMEEARES